MRSGVSTKVNFFYGKKACHDLQGMESKQKQKAGKRTKKPSLTLNQKRKDRRSSRTSSLN
jgi:hypothetical protein